MVHPLTLRGKRAGALGASSAVYMLAEPDFLHSCTGLIAHMHCVYTGIGFGLHYWCASRTKEKVVPCPGVLLTSITVS